MTQLLHIGNRTITETEIIELLGNYQMLPQLCREVLIEQALDPIALTSSEQAIAIERFDAKYQLSSLAQRRDWAEQQGMKQEQLDAIAIREYKIEKFKYETWSPCLESYFLTQKSKLDKVIYSLLRTKHLEVATELYFRIRGGEQSFAQLAGEYSDGPEAQTGGIIGPIGLSALHPDLAKLLSNSQPFQLHPPIRLGEWFAIVRLEKFIPAQLDEPMRQQLLDSLFQAWIQQQVNQEIQKWVTCQKNQEIASSQSNQQSTREPESSLTLAGKATQLQQSVNQSLITIAV